MATTETKHIVILGAGFAGISLARELGRFIKKNPDIQVHLVNQENYFVFQPMLPEVVSCAIEPSHILNPIRHLCPTATFHQATIDGNRSYLTKGSSCRYRHQTTAGIALRPSGDQPGTSHESFRCAGHDRACPPPQNTGRCISPPQSRDQSIGGSRQ